MTGSDDLVRIGELEAFWSGKADEETHARLARQALRDLEESAREAGKAKRERRLTTLLEGLVRSRLSGQVGASGRGAMKPVARRAATPAPPVAATPLTSIALDAEGEATELVREVRPEDCEWEPQRPALATGSVATVELRWRGSESLTVAFDGFLRSPEGGSEAAWFAADGTEIARSRQTNRFVPLVELRPASPRVPAVGEEVRISSRLRDSDGTEYVVRATIAFT